MSEQKTNKKNIVCQHLQKLQLIVIA